MRGAMREIMNGTFSSTQTCEDGSDAKHYIMHGSKSAATNWVQDYVRCHLSTNISQREAEALIYVDLW